MNVPSGELDERLVERRFILYKGRFIVVQTGVFTGAEAYVLTAGEFEEAFGSDFMTLVECAGEGGVVARRAANPVIGRPRIR